MNELVLAAVSAFWLGIITSISPCPLATNIAAISFIGRKIKNPSHVFFSGILYTLGRGAVYIGLGIVLTMGLLKLPVVSHFLQKYMNQLLGPILILSGMVLTNLLTFNLPSSIDGQKFQQKVEKMGLWGSLFLGILFALSFCPTSAALFFGSLIPLAVKQQSSLFIPMVYGIATALPVFFFAILIAFGAEKTAKAYNKAASFEVWFRYITGTLFILVGIYYSLIYIFGLSI